MSNLKTIASDRDKYFDTNYLISGLKTRAVRGAGATVISRSLVYFIHLIGVIVLARLLTPTDFGLVAMVTTFSILLMNFGYNGFTQAIIQEEKLLHKQISTIFWINVSSALSLAVIFAALAPLIASFYNEPRIRAISIAMAFSIIFMGLSTVHLAILSRKMQFYRIAGNEILATIISVISAIAMAYYGWGYWAIVTRQVSLAAATAAGAWIFCGWRPGLGTVRAGVGPMVKFALNVYGNFSMNYFSRNLDKALIGWYHGSQALGFYDRSYHLFSMPANQLLVPLTSVAVAALSRLRNDIEKYHRYYLNSVSMIAFISMPLSAILTIIAKDLVLLLLGEQWIEAGKIFSAFSVSIGIMLIYGTHGWLHLSLGRADRWLRWGIIELVVTGLFFIIGLPFGPLGVALAYSASFYILIGPSLQYAGKPGNIKFIMILSAIWRQFLSGIGAGCLCWFLLHSRYLSYNIILNYNIFIRIFASIVFCLIIYLVLIIAFYQGLKPIYQFLYILIDMVPGLSERIGKKRSGQGGTRCK